MPWMYLDYMAGESKAKQSAALQIGLTWSPEFRYGIGLQTGLYYEMSYQSKTMSEAGVSVKGSLSDHNLSIPLRVQWRYEIVPDWSVFVYTGPSFDIGVGGKIKQSGEAFGESASFEESIYDKEYGFRRFNMLWGVGAGVRWKFLQLRIGGDWGLLNINRMDEKVTLSKPLHVTLSYMF